jgi:histidine decarboxylase
MEYSEQSHLPLTSSKPEASPVEVSSFLEDGSSFEALSVAVIEDILKQFKQKIAQRSNRYLGYPDNLSYDYSKFQDFFQYSLINAGDPFALTDWDLHSKTFERHCIQWFAQLYQLQDYWGYVTSGGTEGNLYGMFLGRELYPDGVLYSSRETHYSVHKAAHFFKIPHVAINSQPHGEIDYDHLAQELANRRHLSAIVNVNLGTTMKGAVDSLERVVNILEALQMRFHLHCDGALGGMLIPFIEGATSISFRDYPIGSIAVSGNKFIGAPIPHGIVLARRSLVQALGTKVEYIGCTDTTILGVRSGLAPLFLWYALQTRGHQFSEEVAACLQNAHNLYDRLQEIGYHPLLNPFSNTVVFDKPPIDICRKWQLATEGNLAHVVVMQHVSTAAIDELVSDLCAVKGTRDD